MSGPALLDADTVRALADDLPGWSVEDGRVLVRTAKFADFDAAYAFVAAVADLAREQDHHPDIAFGWGHATIRLTTHASGGLTVRDATLASEIEGLIPA